VIFFISVCRREKMYTRKQALAFATQIRTCPPQDVRTQKDYQTENKRHRDICPFCSTDIKNEIDAWNALSVDFKKKFNLSNNQDDYKNIKKGQLRILNKNFCRWQEGYYYNAPLVIVLKDQSEIDDEILVAQTWHDIYLASPGDLVVPEKLRTGSYEFFIEPWNIYILKKQYLDQCLGQVADDVVDQTLKMHEDPNILPDWAPRLLPLIEDDPRQYFQELEIKTGYSFSIQAVNELMEKQTSNIFSFAHCSIDTLIGKIKKVKGDIEWLWQPETIEECFALLRFAPESIRLSASADDHKEIIAACLCIRDGEIKAVKPVECPVFHEKSSSEGYTVTGEIPGLAVGMKELSFMCFISDKKNRSSTSGKCSWDGISKNFLAQFDRVKRKDDCVSIIIIDDISEKDRS
jgi:hypothetical protein